MYNYQFHKYYARGHNIDVVMDKKRSQEAYESYMMIRLQKMFKYENLPDSLPQYMLEHYLLSNGSCFVTKYNDNLYAFIGSFGGEPDPYYRPTLYVVANPALKLDKTYQLFYTDGLKSDDGVFMRNDKLWVGLMPLIKRYSYLLAENLITMRSIDIALRSILLITAPDDRTKAAGEAYVAALEKGKINVIAESRVFDGIKLQSIPINNGSYLTQFIELHQYYKASFYNEIGLNTAYNMKRETLSEAETAVNEDILLPLVDSMLECRKEDVARINELFGTDITVDFDSQWKQNILENEIVLQQLEQENVSQLTAGSNNIDNTENVSQLTDTESIESEQPEPESPNMEQPEPESPETEQPESESPETEQPEPESPDININIEIVNNSENVELDSSKKKEGDEIENTDESSEDEETH